MRQCVKCFSLALLLIVVFVLTIQPAQLTFSQSQNLPMPIALVVVIDNSGSMNSNDPNQLSFAATRLIYEVADSNDQIGVICFGSNHATMLPLTMVGEVGRRRNVISQLTKPSCPVGGGTVIGSALDAAVSMLANATATQRYILLLTDGEPNDLKETLDAVDRAQQQQVLIIPLSLYPGSLSNEARLFQDQLRQRRLEPRTVSNSQELIAEFATIYAQLKPDRYVTQLGLGEPIEMRVSALQGVNRVLFVIGADQAIYENDREISCTSQPTRCMPDVEGKFAMLSVEASPVEGIWRLRSANENAVAITRANFRPRLAYPPVSDTAQPGYFLPGRSSPMIIADFEGLIPNDAPITVNGDNGQWVQGNGQTFVFASVPTLQSADVRLGSSDVPLVLKKQFTLRPVPDPEGNLPRLELANPNANGQITLANDNQFALAVRIVGDRTLTSQLTVRAVIFDDATGSVLYGPSSLFARDDVYQSPELITIQPGIPYRAVVWLDAVRGRDQLRYGDLVIADLRVGGSVVVKGLPSLQIEEFDGRKIPITIDVTEANTTVDLLAKLRWDEYPIGADVTSFRPQLVDSQFRGQGNSAEIVLFGPDDLCALPEGNYAGTIEFTTSTGLPVTPSRIPVSGQVRYGNVKILQNEPVDLGQYCSLPGLLNVFCLPVLRNEERPLSRVKLSVPSCINNNNISASLQISEDPGTTVKIGSLSRTGEEGDLTFFVDTVAPQDIIRDFAVQRVYTGKLLIGRKDMPERSDVIDVSYTKFSTLDVFWPGLSRWGNVTGLIIILFVGILSWRWMFGQTRRQKEIEQDFDKEWIDRSSLRHNAGISPGKRQSRRDNPSPPQSRPKSSRERSSLRSPRDRRRQ